MFGHGPRATGHSIDTDVSHHCITPIGFSFRLSKLQQALHYRIIFITKWIFDSTEYEHIRAPFHQVLISNFAASSSDDEPKNQFSLFSFIYVWFQRLPRPLIEHDLVFGMGIYSNNCLSFGYSIKHTAFFTICFLFRVPFVVNLNE